MNLQNCPPETISLFLRGVALSVRQLHGAPEGMGSPAAFQHLMRQKVTGYKECADHFGLSEFDVQHLVWMLETVESALNSPHLALADPVDGEPN